MAVWKSGSSSLRWLDAETLWDGEQAISCTMVWQLGSQAGRGELAGCVAPCDEPNQMRGCRNMLNDRTRIADKALRR